MWLHFHVLAPITEVLGHFSLEHETGVLSPLCPMSLWFPRTVIQPLHQGSGIIQAFLKCPVWSWPLRQTREGDAWDQAEEKKLKGVYLMASRLGFSLDSYSQRGRNFPNALLWMQPKFIMVLAKTCGSLSNWMGLYKLKHRLFYVT